MSEAFPPLPPPVPLMSFGLHKGASMASVPHDYFKWLWKQPWFAGKYPEVRNYIAANVRGLIGPSAASVAQYNAQNDPQYIPQTIQVQIRPVNLETIDWPAIFGNPVPIPEEKSKVKEKKQINHLKQLEQEERFIDLD